MPKNNKKIQPIKNSQKMSKKKTRGIQFGVIVVLTIVSFVLYPLFSRNLLGGSNYVFGSYGGRDIVYDFNNPDSTYFGRQVAAYLSYYQNQGLLQEEGFEEFYQRIIWQQAFNSSVYAESILYVMDQDGYRVASNTLDRAIVERGPFRIDGEFDEKLYRQASSSRKSALREQFRDDITMETWMRDTTSSLHRSRAEKNFLHAMKNPERSYQYVTFPFSDYSDDDVLAYGEDNILLFTSIGLSQITVEDEKTAGEVAAEYEAQKRSPETERYPEEGEERYPTEESEGTGLNNTVFGDLAALYSNDVYKDDRGSLGLLNYHEVTGFLTSDQAEKLFALEQGDLAGPYNTDSGWRLFRVDESPETPVISDRLEDVRSYMLQNEVGLIEDVMLSQAEEFRLRVLASPSFQAAADGGDLEVKETGYFPINFGGDTWIGNSPDGDSALIGTAHSEDFWEKITALGEAGEISAPVILSDNVTVFSLYDIREQDIPFDESGEYADERLTADLGQSRENEYRSMVMDPESPLFEDRFNEMYSQFFPPSEN